ncbi:MAG: thioredoxin-like domain-containing protein, partial [Bacteroidales bacterium]
IFTPMKSLFSRTALLFIMALIAGSSFADKPKYDIRVTIHGLKDTICYLGNYYGDKQYIKDTAKVDSKGYCEFKGDEKLPGGIYLVVTPAKRYFELIIDNEQSFSVETDTNDFIGKMKIKGSVDNQLFYDYLRYINKEQKNAEPLREQLKKVKSNKDSTKLLQDKLNVIDKDVQQYKMDFISKHPDVLLSKVFKASRDPDIPEAPVLPNGKKDSTFAYRYYKHHFFDDIDLTDDRLLRTPVFHNKLKQYITTVIVQHPDSIMKEADSLAEKARPNKEMFKYIVWYVTNWSETSNIMGFDAIFVHMVEKYYNTNQAYWVSPSNLEKMTNRAKVLKGLLLGAKIPNLTMQDTNNVYVTLYNIQAKYTILYFWDPTCGHCQKETPKLLSLYDSLKTLKKSIEVYAVCSDPNLKKEWKKYIKEHHLDWINVMDIQNVTGFHSTFDISSTPVLYLLDENKIILAKRIAIEQLKEFLDRLFKKDAKQKQ